MKKYWEAKTSKNPKVEKQIKDHNELLKQSNKAVNAEKILLHLLFCITLLSWACQFVSGSRYPADELFQFFQIIFKSDVHQLKTN